jgi:cwf21 domain
MSSNVGLTTPRGSGTSGYVQRNMSALKPRDTGYGAPYPPRNPQSSSEYSHRQRQPDQAILAHDRQREVEVQVFELRDKLEEEGEEEEEIERRCGELRMKLLEEVDGGAKTGGGGVRGKGKGLKPHQVHELAEAERDRRGDGGRERKR